ncbi:trigger factor [Parvularcula sp. LCG005]|uniref:trigger factor n=1 Tax=Parvularcula sp. LCG005 TaxID=3078805 RepID=UPI00294356E0|nr:trigger factor [Parvularcula sp. LCG005]WOI52304.1 trigger factor [Parvularcula sp. LCG005]
MQVTEKSAEGLSREFHVVIPQSHLTSRLESKLEEVKGQVQLKGFRKGKAPISFLKKMYGKGMMAELIQEEMAAAQEKALKDNNLTPAMPPHPHLEDAHVEEVLAGKTDLEYDMHVEVLPEIAEVDLAAMSFERPVIEVEDSEVDEELEKLAKEQTAYADRDEGAAAQDGDQVTIDFLGKLDGEAFDGGAGEDVPLVLGSGQFIPGFEEGLVGVKVGDEKTLDITFPEEYGAEHLAGKAATFDVTVKAVKAPEERKIDDELAKALGMDDLEMLRGRIKEMLQGRYASQSRLHVKRKILDALDENQSFDLPPGMVNAEFDAIWRQVEGAERDEEDKDKSDDELKEEYRKIAERRVRLGLVLAEIGKRAEVTVPQKDVERAMQMQAMQAGVPIQQVMEYFRQQPGAYAQLRAPLFEDKVIDHIIETATVTDTTVSKDELMKDPGE